MQSTVRFARCNCARVSETVHIWVAWAFREEVLRKADVEDTR